MNAHEHNPQRDANQRAADHEPEQKRPGYAGPRAGLMSVQRSAGNQAVNHLLDTPSADDPAAVRDRLGDGSPLPGAVRARMERAFGESFGHVRLHTDGHASRMVRHYGAEAFTVGEHIAVKPENYRPGTFLGDALLAHELAHTLQQREATAATPTRQTSSLESDANARMVQALAPASQRQGWQQRLGAVGGHMRSGLQLQFFGCSSKPKTEEEKYEELKETLSDTEQAVRTAQRIYDARGDVEKAARAGEIADTFGRVNSGITRAEQAVQLYEAVGDLQAFAAADPNSDPEGFARAAGTAFVRFGEALELAPPPLNAYGTILKGAENFFVEMAHDLRPDLRYRGTPYEQYMR